MTLRHIPWGSVVVEMLGLAAVTLIAGGIWMIYMPVALIFLGLVCGVPYVIRTLRLLPGGRR